MRIALPPSTLGLFRDIFITVTLFALRKCMSYVNSIRVDTDPSKGLDYVEIICDNDDNLAKCIAQYYNIKGAGNVLISSASEFEEIMYKNWEFSFNETQHKWKISMGGKSFPIRKHSLYDYTKFFYARDPISLIGRDERVRKGKVKPVSGFLDITIDNPLRSRVLWYLDKLASSRVDMPGIRVHNYITASGIPSSLDVLEGYVSLLTSFIRERETRAGIRLEITSMCRNVLSTRMIQEDPDILSKWFELTILRKLLTEDVTESILYLSPPIRVYGVAAGEAKRVLTFFEVDLSAIPRTRIAIDESAKRIGVSTPTLVSVLSKSIEILAQLSSSGDEKVSLCAEALKPHLRIVLNSAFNGSLRPDTLYALVRYVSEASRTLAQFKNLVDVLSGLA